MRELALFAGAGGGLLGTALLGWLPVCAVEIDPYCREVLHARQRDGCLPAFPVWDDVRTFASEPWAGRVDVVSAGFPCQPFSVAGVQRGAGDKRNLWPETERVLRKVRPRWVLLENVPGLVSCGYLGTVLGDLASLGFDAEWAVLGAGDVGAPHRRKRLWIVAHAEHCHERGLHPRPGEAGGAEQRWAPQGAQRQRVAPACAVANADEGGRDRRRKSLSARQQSAPRGQSHRRSASGSCEVADAESSRQRCGGVEAEGRRWQPSVRGMGDPERQSLALGAGGRGDTEAQGEGQRTAPVGAGGGWWGLDPADAPEPGVGRVADGLAPRVDIHGRAPGEEVARLVGQLPQRRQRLEALGNGQVPLCAAVAWRLLRARMKVNGG